MPPGVLSCASRVNPAARDETKTVQSSILRKPPHVGSIHFCDGCWTELFWHVSEGFLKLSRKVFSNFLWQEKRQMTRFEAWLDLIQTAAYAPETVLAEGRRLNLRRGELVASVRYLGVRWNWDKNRVSRFIDLLRSEAMIETRNETGISIIKLCKYELYNPPRDETGTVAHTATGQRRDSDGTNRKKGEEGKEKDSAPPTHGFDEFWQAYPKKHSRRSAQEAWKVLNCALLADEIVAAVELQKGRNGALVDAYYSPKAHDWLNERRWEDGSPEPLDNGERIPDAFRVPMKPPPSPDDP